MDIWWKIGCLEMGVKTWQDPGPLFFLYNDFYFSIVFLFYGFLDCNGNSHLTSECGGFKIAEPMLN